MLSLFMSESRSWCHRAKFRASYGASKSCAILAHVFSLHLYEPKNNTGLHIWLPRLLTLQTTSVGEQHFPWATQVTEYAVKPLIQRLRNQETLKQLQIKDNGSNSGREPYCYPCPAICTY